jgi:MFS family permease
MALQEPVELADAAAAAARDPRLRDVTRFRDVSPYLWLLLASAFLGWMFDAMDLNITSNILTPTIANLLHTADPRVILRYGGLVVAIKLFAWGIGGVVFGVVTDRIGRARTMAYTIAIYSVFTALSAFSPNLIVFALCQALAGIGIGGEWSAGAALIAETWPERLRPRVMQFMQMAFAFGLILAGWITGVFGAFGWRWVLIAGGAPVLITIFVRAYVKEPERWLAVRDAVEKTGDNLGKNPFARIFAPDLRRSTIVGTLAGIAMMVGSWGGLTWIPSWVHQLLPAELASRTSSYVSTAMMLVGVGSIFGYLTLMWLTNAVGRRWSYFLFCAGSLVSSLYLFSSLHTLDAVIAFMPVWGYFNIGAFGTFAAYLPELFPTSARATGQGFAWNVARIFTGFGPIVGGALIAGSGGSFPAAARLVSYIFVLGLIVIWFGPETKGKALSDF